MSGSLSAIFGREAELAAAAAATAAAADGRGTVVLAEGPAGIGKTTLLRAACSAVPGARVLTARGLALEQDYPFGIVRQLFDPVRFAAPGGWGRLLDGAAGLAGRVFDGGDAPAWNWRRWVPPRPRRWSAPVSVGRPMRRCAGRATRRPAATRSFLSR